jgi:hypothetical protein
MPYDPYAPTENERSGIYVTVWIGLAASVIMLLCNFGFLNPGIGGLAALIVGTHLIVFAFSNRFDEHFVALRNFGFTCAMVVIGLWLTAQGLLTVFEGSHDAGYAAAGGPAVDGTALSLPRWFERASLVVSAASVAFYTGFSFAYLRGSR